MLQPQRCRTPVSFEYAIGEMLKADHINAEEHAALLDYNNKRKLSVRVDEFTFDLELVDVDGKPIVVSQSDAA
mgnify:CR=1 FL=1